MGLKEELAKERIEATKIMTDVVPFEMDAPPPTPSIDVT